MKTILKLLPILLLTGLLACKKDKKNDPETNDDHEHPVETGSLKFNFENMVDTNELVFGKKYVTAFGDTFKISKFNYYISHIVVTKADNSTFTEPNSFHLVKHSSPATSVITLANVPVGSYKSVSFMIGVDSTNNVSGPQSGDLDPVVASDMYWSWNTGYIFVKLEGSSPSSGDPNKDLTFHIGGGGGANKAQRSVTLNFGTSTADVSTAVTPLVHLAVDAAEIFKTPTTINLATDFYTMGPGPNAKKYADNYMDMIHFEHVHN